MNKHTEAYLKDILVPENLIKYAEKKGFVIFNDNSKPFNLNIWAVRNTIQKAGEFDDLQIVFWKNQAGQWAYSQYVCTTDPSDLYLFNPINAKGTAIVKPGQYRGLWELGYHKGHSDHPALVQRRPVVVIRDYNKDDILDVTPKNLSEYSKVISGSNPSSYTITYTHYVTNHTYIEDIGYFGINNHRAHRNVIKKAIGNYSAGCIVQNNPDHYYNEFIPLIKNSIKSWGNAFTFTLITMEDLINERLV